MVKEKGQIFNKELKNRIIENLKKVCANIAHKEFFERENKPIALENYPDKDLSITYEGFLCESEIADSLLKIASLKKIYSSSSLMSLVSDIIKRIYESKKILSDELKNKALLSFVQEEDITKELMQFEKNLIDKKNVKNWKILSPLFGIWPSDINELNIGNCRIFILDKERQEKFGKEKEDFAWSLPLFFGGSIPKIIAGNTYLETSAYGYHGGLFERSKIIEEAEINIRKCYFVLKIIIKLFQLKREIDFPFIHPNYWYYVFEDGKEKEGTYSHFEEELVIGKGSYKITKDQIEIFKNNYPFDKFNKLLLNKNPNQIEKRILRALEWFSTGFNEKNASHQFIHYCVALESLLGKKDLFTPLTVELAERVAFLFTRKINTRIRIKSDFRKNIFTLRGKLLHGGYSLSDIDLTHLRILERAVVISIVQILSKVDTIKNDDELAYFFDQERFYPSLTPKELKEIEDVKKDIDKISKNGENLRKQVDSISSKK
ncbi:MAG: hypothetical protein ACFFDS_02660 [Candidatus Thorarchaeota archaeon]